MNSRNFTNFNEFYSKYLIQIKKFLNKKITGHPKTSYKFEEKTFQKL